VTKTSVVVGGFKWDREEEEGSGGGQDAEQYDL
jgi:hypothetical protein